MIDMTYFARDAIPEKIMLYCCPRSYFTSPWHACDLVSLAYGHISNAWPGTKRPKMIKIKSRPIPDITVIKARGL